MLKMAIIEDVAEELLEVVADVWAFDPDGFSVTILPILVAPISDEALRLETSRIVERLAAVTTRAGRTANLPAVDQSLGALDLRKKEGREQLLKYLSHEDVDLILTDCDMGHRLAGLDLLSEAKSMPYWERRDCWLMTQFPDIHILTQTNAVPGNFDPYSRTIDKSLMMKNGTGQCESKLRMILESAIRRKEELHESKTRSRFQGLIGQSPAMQRIYESISTYAKSAIPVLVLGEPGTGKELAARAIHALSGRRLLIAHNCAETPSELIDSVLFGHAKGAFTGAIDHKLGLIESANAGTFFLDEIGWLPLGTQTKLLRVLQEGEVRRLGSIETRKVEIRLISATNRDIIGVPEDKFRPDLLHRINAITITMPPLRDRKEDIPLLVESFITREGKEKTLEGVSPNTMDILMKWNWPGNVRELENLVKVAATEAIRAGSGSIDGDCPTIQKLSRETLRQLVPTASPAIVEIPLGDQAVEQIWDSVRTGRYRMPLSEWSKQIGVPKTTQLIALAKSKYVNREHPPAQDILKFFNMKYNAYKNWVSNHRTQADCAEDSADVLSDSDTERKTAL